MKYLRTLALALLMAVGCTTPALVSDPFPGSIESNYYNGEMMIGTETSSQLGVIEVQPTTAPSSVTMSFYGANVGGLTIDSADCGVDKSYNYTQGQFVTVNLGDMFDQFRENCFFTVTVSPTFSTKIMGPVAVYGYKMGIYLRIVPDGTTHSLVTNLGKFIQLKAASTGVEDVNGAALVVTSTPGTQVAAFHCNPAIPSPIVQTVPANGQVVFGVADLHAPGADCLAQLKDHAGGFSSFIITNYAAGFEPLAPPDVVINGKNLVITGSDLVSLTDVNGAEYFAGTVTIPYNSATTYRIRQYTNKGRNAVCIFSAGSLTCPR